MEFSFQNQKSLADYMRLNEQDAMVKQLQAAQIQQALAKQNEFDLDKLGEQVLYKAAQGGTLSSQEMAIGRAYDAKRQTTMFNPVTGTSLVNKDAFATLGGGGQSPPIYTGAAPPPQMGAVPAQPTNEFDTKFQAQLQAAAGNPKLQQSLRDEYAKNKIQYNEAEAKSAGFADRMKAANPVIEANKSAGTSAWQQAMAATPLIGNYLVSDEYQKLDQASRDFVNAILRRESGAVINPDEFINARKQYLPQPGDSDTVLSQKKLNREAALSGVARSSGAAYPSVDDILKQGDTGNSTARKDPQPATGFKYLGKE